MMLGSRYRINSIVSRGVADEVFLSSFHADYYQEQLM